MRFQQRCIFLLANLLSSDHLRRTTHMIVIPPDHDSLFVWQISPRFIPEPAAEMPQL